MTALTRHGSHQWPMPRPVRPGSHAHNNNFMFTKLLNRRQARWSEFLSRFDFKITYRLGVIEEKLDALTRRSEDLSKKEDERLQHQSQTILKSQNLNIAATNEALETLTTKQLWLQEYREDSISDAILKDLRSQQRRFRYLTLALCIEVNDRLMYDDRIYVSSLNALRLRIVQDHHDAPAAGHSERSKTLKLISRQYFWPSMCRDVEKFCRNCHTCKRSQTSRHAPYGTLRSLLISTDSWRDLSMNFVTRLSWFNRFNAILVILCRLIKIRPLILCRDITTAK
jgi:hypothetical protein